MMRKKFLRATVFLGLISILPSGLNAHRNGSRYFEFLEKPEEIIVKKHSHLAVEFFYLKASTAQARGGGNFGVPELWGKYNLNDVLKSVTAIDGPAVTNPIRNQLPVKLNDTSIPYSTNESINTAGVSFGYEQVLPKKLNCLSVGFWLPVMHVSALGRFSPHVDKNGSINGDVLIDSKGNPTEDGLALDQARRATQTALGFLGNTWDASGLGDLDMHARLNYFLDHKFLMRSIDSYIQVGAIAPIGMKLNNANPLSVPAMNDGHWGANFDLVTELELKQDWKLGLMFGALYQFKETRNRRLPVETEPVVYSKLVAKTEVQPGTTFKFSPYFTLENLTDGIHFQIRYTYLNHGLDKWYDKRSQSDQAQYPSYLTHNNPKVTPEQRSKNIRHREALSKWSAHFFSFHIMYNSKQAARDWVMNPLFYATYDLPVSGSSIAKMHQLSLGAQLHF